MKLSEAADMGRTITTMCVGDWMGCYLGSAANALGMPEPKRTDRNPSQPGVYGETIDSTDRVDALLNYFPWLESNEEHYLVAITSLYDQTEDFDRVSGFVKAVEPPCGSCNTFDCCCERTKGMYDELTATTLAVSTLSLP